jgi:hypothetical protein
LFRCRIVLPALLVLGSACSDPAPRDVAARPEPAPIHVAPLGRAGAETAEARGPSALPAKGTWSLSHSDAGITLIAHAAPRRETLRALARSLGFELVLVERHALAPPLSLELRAGAVADIVGAVLEGIPYSLHYGVGQEGEPELERVVVGRLPEVAAAPPREAEPRRERTPARSRQRSIPPAERDPLAFEEKQMARRAELEHEDPRVRLDAAEWIYADAMGVAVLDDVVRGDPDARVRARAAMTLGEADRDEGDAAANALVAALQDPESQVVLAALEALESVGDETLISELMPLLDHPSAEVRERTSETIDWLE